MERMVAGTGVKKKIAVYLTAEPEGGGSFQYAQVLLRALAESRASRWDIKVWHWSPAWRDYLRKLGLPAEEGRWNFPQRKCRGAVRRLQRILPLSIQEGILRRIPPESAIGAWKPDVLINPGQSYVVPFGKMRQIAAIHDLMHIYEPAFPEVNSPREVRARERLYHGIARYCTDILTDSELGARQVRANYPVSAARLHVLPFAAPDDLLQAVSAAPSVSLPEKFILYPAQFWEHKNHARLVEAAASLISELPDLHVVLTGSRRYGGYQRFIDRLGKYGAHAHFTVTGYTGTPELSWLYRHARAMVMPTFFGPTNIPPLEAMALGCPAAVSKIYGMPEQCGDAVLYLKPDSVESIARALKLLWTDDALCTDLQHKGLQRAAIWNSAHVKTKFLQIVDEMLS